MGPASYDTATLSGWISIACWIIVYQPQIWTCYKLKSGEGLSQVFILIWLAGDLSNLVGAVWQGLLPTMIILALYYSFCDIALLGQIHWYRFVRKTYPERFRSVNSDEESPLIPKFEIKKWYQRDEVQSVLEWLGSIAFVVIVGVGAWQLNRGNGDKIPTSPEEEKWDLKAQIFGWMSAFLYLGSRIPQILKNRETKCQGLSFMMFGFAILGNVTYVLSILLQSLSLHHLWINLSWLVGSGGTIGLDVIVLCQFFWYKNERQGLDRLLKDGEENEGEA